MQRYITLKKLEVIIVKRIIPLKRVYTLNAIPIYIQAYFLVEINMLTLKCIWKCKEPIISKTILWKKVRGYIHTTRY